MLFWPLLAVVSKVINTHNMAFMHCAWNNVFFVFSNLHEYFIILILIKWRAILRFYLIRWHPKARAKPKGDIPNRIASWTPKVSQDIYILNNYRRVRYLFHATFLINEQSDRCPCALLSEATKVNKKPKEQFYILFDS